MMHVMHEWGREGSQNPEHTFLGRADMHLIDHILQFDKNKYKVKHEWARNSLCLLTKELWDNGLHQYRVYDYEPNLKKVDRLYMVDIFAYAGLDIIEFLPKHCKREVFRLTDQRNVKYEFNIAEGFELVQDYFNYDLHGYSEAAAAD
jgi:hypothetical protein